jgi:hypothetical protein
LTGKKNVPFLFTGWGDSKKVPRWQLSKQLSQDEIDRFMAEAERLHKPQCLVRPLLSPAANTIDLSQGHEALLKSIKDITMRHSSDGI